MYRVPHSHSRLQSFLRRTFTASVVFVLVFLSIAAVQRTFGEIVTRLLLTSIGCAVGALLMSIETLEKLIYPTQRPFSAG